LRVLFTSAGRRVALIESFRLAARRLRIPLTVIVADAARLAPTMHVADVSRVVPKIGARGYMAAIKKIVRRDRPDLLIPLIDDDLMPLARARDAFATSGCRAVVSSPEVVRTCRDKMLTYAFLRARNIDTPATWTLDEALARKRHRFPYFLKPRMGSAGLGNARIDDLEALKFYGARVPDPIVQELVVGREITTDIYAGFDGVPRCVVPRERMEVRSGEVSKGKVVKDSAVTETARQVVEALGDCVGVITLQCIVDAHRRIRVIEINPRFGGGVPLAIAAGADFPRWLMTEARSRRPRIRMDGFREGLHMLRYDEAVFVPARDV